MSSLAVQPYRDCYAACRAGGGTIQACEQSCAEQMPGDVCDPCCGLWTCYAENVGQTVQSVTGAVYQYLPGTFGEFSGLVKWLVVGAGILLVYRVLR